MTYKIGAPTTRRRRPIQGAVSMVNGADPDRLPAGSQGAATGPFPPQAQGGGHLLQLERALQGPGNLLCDISGQTPPYIPPSLPRTKCRPGIKERPGVVSHPHECQRREVHPTLSLPQVFPVPDGRFEHEPQRTVAGPQNPSRAQLRHPCKTLSAPDIRYRTQRGRPTEVLSSNPSLEAVMILLARRHPDPANPQRQWHGGAPTPPLEKAPASPSEMGGPVTLALPHQRTSLSGFSVHRSRDGYGTTYPPGLLVVRRSGPGSIRQAASRPMATPLVLRDPPGERDIYLPPDLQDAHVFKDDPPPPSPPPRGALFGHQADIPGPNARPPEKKTSPRTQASAYKAQAPGAPYLHRLSPRPAPARNPACENRHPEPRNPSDSSSTPDAPPSTPDLTNPGTFMMRGGAPRGGTVQIPSLRIPPFQKKPPKSRTFYRYKLARN
ncbi:WAS/WASL-interacting protein family member 1-like [Penaeus monodon]|uniref:WAS/WASL-interacting protein family member 1-like n=1 Tax=Penaeus monodon TaxID=6687 RepID=UPI0018A77D72|nr:WAS/WASL-interacting protein family member 1-like [Penaeus monodon]